MTLPAAYFDGDGDPNRLDQPSDHHDKHASWQTDASGNVTGLVGPDGAAYAALPLTDPYTGRSLGWRAEPYAVRNFGAKQDGRYVSDGAMTNGTSILNSATLSFTASDVGKLIAIGPLVDTRNYWKFGTVLQVNSSSQVVTSFTAAQAYSAARVIIGSDDSAAFASALSAASLGGGGAVYVEGICCVRGPFTVPNGVWLEGNGAIAPPNGLQGVFYSGSTLIRMDAVSATEFISLGSVDATHNRHAGIYGMTIDNLDMYGCVQMIGYGCEMFNVTALGGSTVVNGGPSGTIHGCYIVGDIGSPNSGVLHVPGDMKVSMCQIYGVGAGKSVVQLDGNGSFFCNNHIYAGSSNYAATQAGIRITTASSRGGNNIVSNNTIDCPYGPAILLDVAGTSVLSNVCVQGNNSYQNSAVPANTHPFIKLATAVGAELRGCSLLGNNGRSGWDDPTDGTWTYMVDHAEHLGAANGVLIAHNNITDVVGTMYSGGETPPAGMTSSNNIIVRTSGAVVVG